MAIFQHYMDTLLAGITGIQPYLDDTLNTGRTPEEHKNRLRRFVEADLQLQKEKFIFAAPSVEFLWFHIDTDGMRLTQDKVKAIKEILSSQDKSELESFLGLLNFYNCFLPDSVGTYLTRQLLGIGLTLMWKPIKRHRAARWAISPL